MARRRETLEYRDLRKYIERTGDISIGAYARRQRWQRIGVSVIGALLIVFAGVFLWRMQVGGAADAGRLRQLLACTQCGRQETRPVDADVVLPLTCTACQRRTLFPLWRCALCNKTQIWPQREGDATLEGPSCKTPQCTGRMIAAINPADVPALPPPTPTAPRP